MAPPDARRRGFFLEGDKLFIIIQFPLSDIRSFIKKNADRLLLPTFPIPETDKEFIRSLGISRDRIQGGLHSWPGEEVYCDAHRAIRFPDAFFGISVPGIDEELRVRCGFRRFYSDGNVVSRVEVGIKLERYPESVWQYKQAYKFNQIISIINSILSIPVTIHLPENGTKSCSLIKSGPYLSSHYLQASTKKRNGKIAKTESWWMSSGKPIILIEVEPYEFGLYFSEEKLTKIRNDFSVELSHFRMELEGKKFGAWLISKLAYFPKIKDRMRRLRVHLSRLHSERESLRQVLRLITRKKLNCKRGSTESDDLQEYLSSMTSLLEKKKRAGCRQSEFLKAIQNFEDMVKPGERTSLLNQLSKIDIRKNLLNRIEQITRPVEDDTSPIYILGANASINIGKEQTIGGNTMSKTEITIGDNAYIIGDIITADTINDSFNNVASSDCDQELKEKTTELISVVAKMCENLPNDKAQEAARDLRAITAELTSKSPRQKWYEVSSEGLIEAAKAVGEIGKPVIKILHEIGKLFGF